ncbi:sigma-70 family RNA polymerase sigma factor [Aureibaculum sp. A20]|uniref:Sigma-70 family RNA polymerase sigma factor n=1 Tax=Aureibaculum flavum TaxID=2795986 RepID=A0ABS0WP83_9FLAO|nr:sigma-70 family RNA polymerase sigma factor [Aureibaculum flavum]MBJ2173673.1 sigma-70 family RNA polymerase sigma factor [Aureibaculum flavum]
MRKSGHSYLIDKSTLSPNRENYDFELENANMFVVNNSENLVWNRLREGHESALGELYDQHIEALFSYGVQHSQDRGHIMDCIHDLFVDLYKYRKKLSTTNNVKYYLFKSLKRKINKKYKNKAVLINKDFDESIHSAKGNYAKSPEDKLIQKEHIAEQNTKLSSALSTLTKNQRRSLYLRFNQEKKYEEISEIMEVTIATARTTVYRAIKMLRKHRFYN